MSKLIKADSVFSYISNTYAQCAIKSYFQSKNILFLQTCLCPREATGRKPSTPTTGIKTKPFCLIQDTSSVTCVSGLLNHSKI